MSFFRKIIIAKARIQMSSIRAYILNWDLATKFRIVASAPWAEPLGLCGLTPEEEYPIIKFRREEGKYSNIVIVFYISELYPGRDIPYQLPEANVKVVKDEDIEKVNSGQVKYNLIRRIKKFQKISI